MTLDVVIKGGAVIDGTGAPAAVADVGIKDGRIVEIGRINAPAGQRVDASGALVTPGFVDIHTHYDGQVSWDSEMKPSVNNGVTTVVMGNCGVGFAPCRPSDRDTLIKLMEGVEDIPGTALHEGITWEWETFAEYIEAIDRLSHTIDIGTQLPHNPLRLHVMGPRAVAREKATSDDLRKMQEMTIEALNAGALGFSSANTVNHRDSDGNPTYARLVAANELYAIGDAMRDSGKGVLQILNDFYQENAQDFPVLVEWARRSGRPLSFTLEQDDSADTTFWREVLDGVETARAQGINIRPQVAARSVGAIFTLSATVNPLVNRPSYFAIAGLPLQEKVRIMRDPSFKAKVLSEAPMSVAEKLVSVSPRIDDDFRNMATGVKQLYLLDDTVDYEQPKDRSLWAIARMQNRDVFDVAYDALLQDDGQGLIFSPIMNYADGDFEAVLTMLNYQHAILGLGDAGAHAKYISDGSFSTYILSYWTRDRKRGPRIPIERAIQLQTTAPADHLGLYDRGRLAVGAKADINVIDAERLQIGKPVLVPDLPGGSSRFLQRAEGYIATFVSGTRVIEDDRLTGNTPGRVVRGAQPAAA